MQLKEAKQALDAIKQWSDGLKVQEFNSGSGNDQQNVTTLTEMQADLTAINTKIGNLIHERSGGKVQNDANAPHKASQTEVPKPMATDQRVGSVPGSSTGAVPSDKTSSIGHQTSATGPSPTIAEVKKEPAPDQQPHQSNK